MNAAISAAVARSKLGTREIALRVYGDKERFRDISRYMRKGGPTPTASTAVLLAAALGEKPHAFLGESPLDAVARELAEANQQAEKLSLRLEQVAHETAAGFEAIQQTLAELDRRVDELGRRRPPEAERGHRKTP